MSYPKRFYVIYPSAGVAGLLMVVQLREYTMPNQPLWWLLGVGLAAFGTSMGWVAAKHGPGEYERGERAPLGKAAWGATLAIPLVLYARRRIDPEYGVWFFGLLLLALFFGFALGVCYRVGSQSKS